MDSKPPRAWPAAEVEMRPVAKLIPYARNARKHSKKQVAQIVESINRWGWTVPVLVDESGEIIAGHGRLLAAEKLGIDRVPCMVARGWSEAEKRAYTIADNQLAANSSWDTELLRLEVSELALFDEVPLTALGFDTSTLDKLLAAPVDDEALQRADEIDDVPEKAVSRRGDVWHLGPHRVLCGDSTDPADVDAVLAGALADLVHADPPYGMGKEADGVQGDNVYGEKLDAFQLSWLRLALARSVSNCSLYVWGNAPDLWRLWYRGGLNTLDDLVFRNELVWAKGTAIGQNSNDMQTFPPETERCLFFMRGLRFASRLTKSEFNSHYEPVRAWLAAQLELLGWKNKDVHRITKTKGMAGHWFTKSQFQVIQRQHYDALRAAALGKGFGPSYTEFLAQFADDIAAAEQQHEESRAFFDNTHENLTDVWQFPRVRGAERFGHATPKPVAMLARAILSSCPKGGLVFEPFLGTGSTLIAAGMLERRCAAIEVEPRFVDVAVQRWQKATGLLATLGADGATFADVAHGRDLS